MCWAGAVHAAPLSDDCQAVCHTKQRILRNLEVGDWAGGISKAELPERMIVDYVRVRKKEQPQ